MVDTIVILQITEEMEDLVEVLVCMLVVALELEVLVQQVKVMMEEQVVVPQHTTIEEEVVVEPPK